jgi:prepilin signal peptidase PulO-like enzyme (type II secretory pathway)
MHWSETPQEISLVISVIWFFRFCSNKFLLDIHLATSVVYAISLVYFQNKPLFIFTATVLLVIAEIDRKEYRIPDSITKPSLFLLTLFQVTSFGVLAVAWGWVLVMYLLTTGFPHLIGRGDIKLIGVLTLVAPLLSERSPLSFLGALLLLSSVLALPGAIKKRKDGQPYPFAPAISGASLALFGIGAL